MSRTLGVSMRREGYDPPFIAAIIAAASTIAALMPPSITAVGYGAVGNVSIAGLFMAAARARLIERPSPHVRWRFLRPPRPREQPPSWRPIPLPPERPRPRPRDPAVLPARTTPP